MIDAPDNQYAYYATNILETDLKFMLFYTDEDKKSYIWHNALPKDKVVPISNEVAHLLIKTAEQMWEFHDELSELLEDGIRREK